MSDANDWNRKIIEEFRANEGKVGGNFEGMQLLLLHTRGARTGQERVNPLAYYGLGESVAVFGSKGGATTNPDWFYNVVAHPDVEIEIGPDTRRAIARVAKGEERERIWEAQKAAAPGFAGYETTAGSREIPVIVLDPPPTA